MNNKKALLFVGIVCLTVCGFALAGGMPEPNNPNLNNDSVVDFYDFALMSENWQQSGIGLVGDFDDSNTVDIDDLMEFCQYWLWQYSEYQQCQGIDLDNDGLIAFEDMAKFAQNWLLMGTGLTGDFDDSNSVDCNDLSIFADCWLKGSRPESIWEQFKAALAAGDVNTALTFISDVSRDKYAEVFQVIGARLPDYVAGMGDLILILNLETDGIARYEMRHQASSETYLFPVVFRKNEQEIWQIYGF
jgi:hypothetical protein